MAEPSNELRDAFVQWVLGWDEQWDEIVNFAEERLRPKILSAASMYENIDPSIYEQSTEVYNDYIYPSMCGFLVAFISSQLSDDWFPEGMLEYDDVNRFGLAYYLCDNDVVPIFDGLAWRLHSISTGEQLMTAFPGEFDDQGNQKYDA